MMPGIPPETPCAWRVRWRILDEELDKQERSRDARKGEEWTGFTASQYLKHTNSLSTSAGRDRTVGAGMIDVEGVCVPHLQGVRVRKVAFRIYVNIAYDTKQA